MQWRGDLVEKCEAAKTAYQVGPPYPSHPSCPLPPSSPPIPSLLSQRRSFPKKRVRLCPKANRKGCGWSQTALAEIETWRAELAATAEGTKPAA